MIINARSNRLISSAIAISLVFVLSSCGTPSKQYVGDSKEGVFMTVPNGWQQISGVELNKHESTSTVAGASDRLASVKWQVAYSPNKKYRAKDVLSLLTPSSPIVYIRVRSLLSEEINSISYNSMRDVILPLTTWASGTDKTAPPFVISVDEEKVQKGGRGVHTVFSFTNSKGSSQTIDQTVLLSNDHSKIYLLIARCSALCYTKQIKLLDSITHSFTVKGLR